MKTTTILEAWDKAAQLAEMHPDDRRELRRATRMWHGLVRRIEQGDRAREALKLVEWYDNFDCPWCGATKYAGKWGDEQGKHAPDCPRQIALGVQEAK